ncbi:hypothetical protein NPD5_3941 [Clostridium sporogenes]|uniref:Uncharacterized protein n=2 Tax=Clostridium TaxID=1485 RepID=A0A1J1CSK9_CLOSG|nr:hypothetical protein [Clostridium sporogenes]APF25257.1 hypothetical protein NPD7_3845 [Clostridium sporogenes]APH15549.1 hypothetical protein NPD5_3941 [Clostridium sporogenes]
MKETCTVLRGEGSRKVSDLPDRIEGVIMISDKEFKRLSEIDEKMLNNKQVTNEELKERTEIIQKFKQEVDKAYLKHQGII